MRQIRSQTNEVLDSQAKLMLMTAGELLLLTTSAAARVKIAPANSVNATKIPLKFPGVTAHHLIVPT